MKLRLPRPLLRRALLRPEPLLALLLLLAAAAFLATSFRERRPPPARVEISEPEPVALETSEVRLVRYDADGLEKPAFVSVALPQSPSGRLRAILDALREATLGQEWPEALPAPKVFVESAGREAVAVLDFRPEARLSLTVAGETRLLRSIERTVLANGADQIRFLLNGEAAGVFLEHLAVPSAL